MKFSKTLVAAALLASAGAANASIAYNTAASELFLQVYDQSRGLTYDFDLGQAGTVTLVTMPGITSLHYDLSADANWSTFVSGMDAASTKFGVVAGYTTSGLLFTSNGEPVVSSAQSFGQVATAIKNQAGKVNTGLLNTPVTEDYSRLVSDSDTASTGQWAAAPAGANPLTTLYGTFGAADAAIAYGASGNFLYETYDGVAKKVVMQNLGTWTLSAGSLDFSAAPASAVPLPAAVWMFGAGLMGVLRLNRRKSAAI